MFLSFSHLNLGNVSTLPLPESLPQLLPPAEGDIQEVEMEYEDSGESPAPE